MADQSPFAAVFTKGEGETDDAYAERISAAFEEMAKQLSPGTGKQVREPGDDSLPTDEFDESS